MDRLNNKIITETRAKDQVLRPRNDPHKFNSRTR